MQSARKSVTFDTVRELALSLTGVVDSTAYGSPALKLHGNLLACMAVNKSAEPNSAVFSIDPDLRAMLLRSKPTVYYLTDHYAPYPRVLVRLASIDAVELQELLGLAWSFVAAQKTARVSPSKSNSGKRRPQSRRGHS